jgi:hypothetical protein
MRIRELFEGNFFKETDFVQPKEGGGRELNFSLEEDLAHFMEHDDEVYRRHMYPRLAEFLEAKKSKKEVKPSIFAPAVKESYKLYIKKFPIRELPDEIDKDVCEQVCEKLFTDHNEYHANGLYKD